MAIRRRLRSLGRRLTYASAAFLLGDVIVGCTVFSIAALAILAGFGWGWISLANAYAAHAMVFGSAGQFRSAVGLLVVCPVYAILVAWIGVRSFELPRRLWRAARSPGPGTPIPTGRLSVTVAAPNRGVPMSDGALWALRLRRRPEEYRFVSLLLPGP